MTARVPDARGPDSGGPSGSLRHRGLLLLVLVTVALSTLLSRPARGQEREPATDTTGASPPATGGWKALAVVPRPWTPVVAVSVVLPRGSASDPPDGGGTAWLLGEGVRRAVLSGLEPGGVELTVEVERSRAAYRLLAEPARWKEVYGRLEGALFGALPPRDLERVRARLREVLTFERDAPVREFELEMFRVMTGLADPWTRDPRGTVESLDGITVADLLTYRSEHYRRAEAVVSITGAVAPDDALAVVTGIATDTSKVPGGPARTGTPHGGVGQPVVVSRDATPPPSPVLWEEGERLRMMRQVTSTWIGVALPVAPGTDWTALEMFMHRLQNVLVSDPPDPGLFSADVRLEHHGRSSVLLVEAAVLPEATGAWERRILEAVDTVGEPIEPAFFRFHRRRFRTARLLAESTPEAEGLRLARDLVREGRIRDLPREIWNLEPDALVRVRRNLGEPRIVVFGPDLTDETGAGGRSGANPRNPVPGSPPRRPEQP